MSDEKPLTGYAIAAEMLRRRKQCQAQSELAAPACSVATRTIADSIAEYKATRGTPAVKLLHHVLGKLIGLKCNHCGKEVSVVIDTPPNAELRHAADNDQRKENQ